MDVLKYVRYVREHGTHLSGFEIKPAVAGENPAGCGGDFHRWTTTVELGSVDDTDPEGNGTISTLIAGVEIEKGCRPFVVWLAVEERCHWGISYNAGGGWESSTHLILGEDVRGLVTPGLIEQVLAVLGD